MFCTKCGCKNIDGAKFCRECGEPFTQCQSDNLKPVGEIELFPSEKVNVKLKKCKKKRTVAFIAAVLAIVIALVFVNSSLNIIVFCKECGIVEADWRGRGYSTAMCWECFFNANKNALVQYSTTYDGTGTFEYTGILPGEVFTIISGIPLHTASKEYDTSSAKYYYELEDSATEHIVKIEIEILPEEWYDFETTLIENYEEDLGQHTYANESGSSASGFPMIEFWNATEEGETLEVQLYTDKYYYIFKVSAEDKETLTKLYYNIKNMIVE